MAEEQTQSVDESMQAIDSAAMKKAIDAARETMVMHKQAMVDKLNKQIDDTTQDQKKAMLALEAQRVAQENESMMGYSRLMPIANERARSLILTEDTRRALDEINYKVVQGYNTATNPINGVGLFGTENPFLKSRLNAIGVLYKLQVNLFCNPEGMETPPPGCGGDRVRAGIKGNENFVDFILSERTWPQDLVMDTMQLARAYFFGIPERFSITSAKEDKGGAIAFQRVQAGNSIRMAMLNFLAARRAPTSTATTDVLKYLLQTFAVSGGNISSTNYEQICNKANPDSYLESYACSLTNIPKVDPNNPNAPPQPRIMGQAAIDRIMQYDFYLSPIFYQSIHQVSNPVGQLDKMEVFMIAQHLAQDYYFFRMLQMKTAAEAINNARSYK